MKLAQIPAPEVFLALLPLAATCRCPGNQRKHRRKICDETRSNSGPQGLLRSAAVSRTLYLSLALLRLAAACRCPEKQRNHRRKYAVKVARVRARKVSLARCVLAVPCNGPGYQGKHRRNRSVKVAKLRAWSVFPRFHRTAAAVRPGHELKNSPCPPVRQTLTGFPSRVASGYAPSKACGDLRRSRGRIFEFVSGSQVGARCVRRIFEFVSGSHVRGSGGHCAYANWGGGEGVSSFSAGVLQAGRPGARKGGRVVLLFSGGGSAGPGEPSDWLARGP